MPIRNFSDGHRNSTVFLPIIGLDFLLGVNLPLLSTH